MRILITGASGLVGGHCLDHLQSYGHDCLGTYYNYKMDHLVYLDTLNPIDCVYDTQGREFIPDYIIHSGSLTHVDYCELHPQESAKNIVLATHNIIHLAKKYNSQIAYISTDYVFDGINGPYTESDITNPICTYGKQKQFCEELLQQSGLTYLILRVTNLYGFDVRYKNFTIRLMKDVMDGVEKTIHLPIDQYSTPVHALDIAKAIGLLLQNQVINEILHISGNDYVNRLQIAQEVLSVSPVPVPIKCVGVQTTELSQVAPRPLRGGLDNNKFKSLFPDFQFITLKDYALDFYKNYKP
jgi:dTDP-4-dehydrorhamnose reductase